MARRITVTEVARVLGKDPQVVREYIKDGLFPFAVAKQLSGSTKWDYTIFPAKYEEYCVTGGKPDLTKLYKRLGIEEEGEVLYDEEDEEDDWYA